MHPLLAILVMIDPVIDPTQARGYLADLSSACAPARTLWNHDLCGPVVLVDPKTRDYITADGEGKLPANIGMANTAVDWDGRKWTMILWPLPSDRSQRLALMLHESYHRIQADLGLPMTSPENPHLDTLDGRYWLQLEFRALAAALKSEGAAQRRAAADAVAFRRKRRDLFPTAAASERALEMNEGLAEYTGVALSGDPHRLALLDLETYAAQPTFVRSFAYATGPAYGLLLDIYKKDWRADLKPTADLANLLDLDVPANPPIEPYDGATLRAREVERDQARLLRIATLRKLLVNGPVLVLPLEKMGMDFDPNNLIPFDNLGTVYPTITIRDIWGSIQVTRNALLSSDFKKLTVTAGGSGWKLDLKPGWQIVPGARPGDKTIALK